MTQEEKQLLSKDLCARLLYGVKCYVDDPLKGKLTVIPHSMLDMDGFECHTEDWEYEQFYSPDELTPYLRPLSSMTVEEICKIEAIIGNGFKYKNSELMACSEDVIKLSFPKIHELMEFLYQHHIDVNGFIPMGLALEAPVDMYKF